MKRAAAVLAGIFALAFLVSTNAQAAAHQYTGASKCKICHMAAKKGDQFGIWSKSKHAEAYTALTTPAAMEVAKKAGKGGMAPSENPACLKCHVTGWDAAADMKGPKYDKAEGVTCEACHGAGADYSPLKVMKDKAAAVAAGLVIPDEKTCTKCHNSESPTFKSFDYKTYHAKIVHLDPTIAK